MRLSFLIEKIFLQYPDQSIVGYLEFIVESQIRVGGVSAEVLVAIRIHDRPVVLVDEKFLFRETLAYLILIFIRGKASEV